MVCRLREKDCWCFRRLIALECTPAVQHFQDYREYGAYLSTCLFGRKGKTARDKEVRAYGGRSRVRAYRNGALELSLRGRGQPTGQELPRYGSMAAPAVN